MAQISNNSVVFVKPSTTLISDLPALKSERDDYTGPGADRSKLPAKVREEIEELKGSIARHGVRVPGVGYVENGKIKLISGRSRRGLLMELQSEDEQYNKYKLPVLIVPKGDPAEMLAIQSDINVKTVKETPLTTLQTYQRFKELKLKNAEIGEFVGKTETWVTQVLKVGQVKVLTEWIAAGKIDLSSATLFVSQKYLTKDKKSWDEKAILEALKKAAEIAKSGGSSKIKQGAAKAANSGETAAKPFLTKTIMKIVIDAPIGKVPEEIKILFLLALKSELSLEEAIKRARGKLNWLKEVLKAAEAAAEAKKAEKGKGKGKGKAKAKPAPEEEEEDEFENEDVLEDEEEETEDEESEDFEE